jgi:hypothetical protein
MSEGMPYHMHKGHTWQTIDRYLSTKHLDKRAARKALVLGALRDEGTYPRFTDIFTLIAPSSYTPPGSPPNPVDALIAHMNKDWFGLEQTGNTWGPQKPYAPGRTTGFWSNWYGDAEAIVRATTARAIEVSFNVDHGSDIPTNDNGEVTDETVSRNWPIEFWWLCGMRWLHASLTWRHEHANDRHGVVVVTWITPGNGDEMYHDLDAPPKHNEDHTFAIDPIDASTRFGSWIVGQPNNHTYGAKSWEGTGVGKWPSPVGVTHSSPEGAHVVTTVQPAFGDGGVSNQQPEWDY